MWWFTADCHINHDAIRRHCDRPFKDLTSMNDTIIANWNDTVSEGDDVCIVGDFIWNNHNLFLSKLKGRKHLVIGNHDKTSERYLAQFTSSAIIKIIREDGITFTACHYAMRVWPKQWRDNSIHIHGHSHGRLPTWHNAIDVGMDPHNFRLLSGRDIVELVEKNNATLAKSRK